MAEHPIQRALQLASDGRAGLGAALLEQEARAGNADALYSLGLWSLEGRHLPRDLAAARRQVTEAAVRGSLQAARTLSAFLALGIGAGPDWAASLKLLEAWEDRDPIARRQMTLIEAMQLDPLGDPREQPALEAVSERPWVRRLPRFFSPAEVQFVTDLAQARFKPALVFNQRERRFVAHPFRDASVAAFSVTFEWPVLHALNRRIAAASGTEVSQGESLQVLRYQSNQQYRDHLDAVPGLANQRVLTMLVALTEDFEGGETRFPAAGLTLRGGTGDGLLFRNVDDDGRPDPSSLHAGAPVARGTKLIASRWIRAEPPPAGESFGAHEVLSDRNDLRQESGDAGS